MCAQVSGAPGGQVRAGEEGPRYPEVVTVLHPKSAVISAGWAAQALRGYGCWPADLAEFLRQVSADGYARAEDVIAEWVTVAGRLEL
jgi:hypothetical protein